MCQKDINGIELTSLSYPTSSITSSPFISFIIDYYLLTSKYKSRYIRLILYTFNQKKMTRYTIKKKQAPQEQQTILYDQITKVETEILERIQKLKITSKNYNCQHFDIFTQDTQPYDPNINYYDKFWKSYLIAEIGRVKVKLFKQQCEDLKRKLERIEDKFRELDELTEGRGSGRRKRAKLNEQQIQRFQCQRCQKAYADKDSLNIHIRLKHHRIIQHSQSQQREGLEQMMLDVSLESLHSFS